MASTDTSVTSLSPNQVPLSSEPRIFPPQSLLRYLDSTLNQGQEICTSVKITWDENIVRSDSLQLSVTPDQIRDLVYHGSTELRKHPIVLIDPSIFRTCVRWILLYQRTWAEAKNDTDLKVLALSWNDLLHHGPQSGDQRHWFLDHAANSYQQFYEASRTGNNFDNSRALARAMLSSISTPRQYVQAHKRMGRLMGIHSDSFHITHKDWRPIVNTSIHYLNLAIAKLAEYPDIDPVTSDKQLWEYCAWALEQRYEASYQDEDILKAIEYYQVLMVKDKDNVKEWLLWCDKLARSHWKRFRTLRIVKEGKDGIAGFEKILEIEPENPYALTGLAELLRQTANAEVLSNATRREITNRSIELLECCLAKTPDDHSNLANRLGKLSEALVERYGYDADVDDIDMAIALQITAIGLPKQSLAALAFHHKQISEKYILKFQYTKDREDIDAAIMQIQKCIEMSADLDGQARGNAKLGLARAYGAWYNIYHQLEQLELAISNGEDALKLCAESGWRSIAALDDLAQLYRHRFERLQNYDDASKGIKYIREAINMLRGFAGKNNLNHEAECLSSLSKLLRARAEAYHAEEDLNNAVRAEHDALQITDAEHKEYTPRAVDLSYNLTARFRVIGNLEDLNEADNILNVASQNLKLRRIPATSRELSLVENQHGIVSVCRWQAEGDNKWVREGLTYFKTAAAIDPSSLAFSQNYASAVTSLARHSGELIDAITAVKAFLTYVENIEKYAPETAEKNLPLVLEKLARLYVDKMKTENNKAMWTPMCVRLLEQLCQANKAQVGVRLWAAGERSAMAAWREDDFEAASRFISLAVSLLPELLNPGLNRVDQLRLIKNNSNLPGFTLAFHIMAGHKISEALQRFEQARGVLWNRLLRESDELDSLNEIDQELAKQFRESHTRLLAPRKPLVSLENDTSMVFNAADSYADALEYNTLLTKIRLQPGLENFLLLPADPAELSSYADDGAIVVINCAHNYSHAIIVTSLETAVLKLPDYSEKSAKRLYEMMKSALDCLKQQDETSATKLFEELCTALWNSIAKPVLDKLDEVLPQDSIRQWNSKPVHRIWWLANQWINVLPIHAAGDYSCRSISDEARSVLDRAISSYIPSFGALKFARKNDTAKRLSTSSSQVRDQPSALIISMPSTPGQTSLPNATKEVNTITEQLALSNIAVTNLAEDSATKKSITSALKTASVAHFVCHGLVDPTDPLKSQLVHTDSHRNPLDVRTLIRTQMPACTLVYLSVCNAAASETLPLVDEGLHIAGGFLMAGVPQVIATQWELADQLGVQVAERFYAHLVDGGEGGVGDSNDPAAAVAGLDVSHSAEALRDVLLTIRADGVPGILYGAYVHYGV